MKSVYHSYDKNISFYGLVGIDMVHCLFFLDSAAFTEFSEFSCPWHNIPRLLSFLRIRRCSRQWRLHRCFRWLAARIVVIDTLVLFVLQLRLVSKSIIVQIFHHLHVPESLGLIDWSFAPPESISSYVDCTARSREIIIRPDSHRGRAA